MIRQGIILTYLSSQGADDFMDKICLKCIFYNPDFPYGCEMSDDLPVVCSVKMKMKKEEIREVKYGRKDNN